MTFHSKSILGWSIPPLKLWHVQHSSTWAGLSTIPFPSMSECFHGNFTMFSHIFSRVFHVFPCMSLFFQCFPWSSQFFSMVFRLFSSFPHFFHGFPHVFPSFLPHVFHRWSTGRGVAKPPASAITSSWKQRRLWPTPWIRPGAWHVFDMMDVKICKICKMDMMNG